MKISQMIQDLERVREWIGGDADVFIKEHNGMFNHRISVGGDLRVMVEGDGEADEKVCVITSLLVFR